MILEHSEKNNPHFDAIIVHGAGVVGNIPGHDGMWRTVAAIQAYEEGLTNRLVFSGGHTSGPDRPSEAQAMVNFTSIEHTLWQPKQPDIPTNALFQEDSSMTTAGNLRAIIEFKRNDWKNIALLTNRYHIPYVRRLAANLGLAPHLLAAEDLMLRRNPEFEQMIKDYYSSPEMIQTKRSQTILKTLLMVDPYAKIPELIASYTRK